MGDSNYFLDPPWLIVFVTRESDWHGSTVTGPEIYQKRPKVDTFLAVSSSSFCK